MFVVAKNYLVPQQQIPDDVDEENLEEEENMGIAETYADYMPSKVTIGLKHPDPVVETASLASVVPPDVCYELSLPDKTIKSGSRSLCPATGIRHLLLPAT